MTNIINNQNLNNLQDSRTSSAAEIGRSQATKVQQDSSASGHGETITMTETAKLLNKLSEQISNIPVIDRQHVDKVLQQLNQHENRSDYSTVANKLIQHEASLHARQQR